MASARRHAARLYLSQHRHSAFLAAIIAAFAVRPVIGDAQDAAIAFSVALLLLMVVALYTIEVDELVGERSALLVERRRQRIIGWTLAILAVVERLLTLAAPSPYLLRISTVGWLLFFIFVTGAKLRSLLKQKVVTGEAISLSISVYLLFGLTWGLLYIVMYQHHSDAFNFDKQPDLTAAATHDLPALLPVFVYFSLTTLATIGYGDITPVTLSARYASVAEGIAGQFYLAILVARLVTLQMSHTDRRD